MSVLQTARNGAESTPSSRPSSPAGACGGSTLEADPRMRELADEGGIGDSGDSRTTRTSGTAVEHRRQHAGAQHVACRGAVRDAPEQAAKRDPRHLVICAIASRIGH